LGRFLVASTAVRAWYEQIFTYYFAALARNFILLCTYFSPQQFSGLLTRSTEVSILLLNGEGMEIDEIPHSYLILTSTVPCEPYQLDARHAIRAVKAEKWMFEGFEVGVPNGYLAIMSLPYVGEQSYDVWRDLVMFHSFVCNDPETYHYSEVAYPRTHENSRLKFVTDKAYFYERTRLTTGGMVLKDERQLRVNALDFDQLRLLVYPTAKESTDKPLSPEEEAALRSEGMLCSEVEPELSAAIQYRRAFQVFSGLKLKDKRLYDQMRLYIFAKSTKELTEVYRNYNFSVAFYVSILETLAGEPPKCNAMTICPECGRPLPPHHKESIEQWLMDSYGSWFKRLRKIRQKLFHESDYFDIGDVIYEIRHSQDEGRWPGISRFEDEVELLEKIARKSLIKAFMSHYDS
jgi:hypothetical protein